MADQGNLHRYFDAVPGALCLITADDEERIVFASRQMLDLCRCADDAGLAHLTGGRFCGLTVDTDADSLVDLAGRAASGGADYSYVSFSLRPAEGASVQVEGSVKKVELEGRPYWSLLLVDMRRRQYGIEGDTVTGLVGMHEYYEKALAIAARNQASGTYASRCPIYFNIANFKAYNRLHGIKAGDDCLRFMADELRSRFPRALIAHMAADGFVVLASVGDETFARIEAACAAIDAFIDNPRIRAKAGVFLAATPALAAVAPRDTVDYAKIACDSIKGDAGACWAVYTESMGRELEARARVLEHFESALKNGSIKVFAQPIVRTFTGKVCALEALARWDTPEGDRMSPAEFIPVLEEARLIHELDLHVVDFVMRMLRSEIDAGHEVVPVSINISRVDFGRIDVFEAVDGAAAAFDIPHDLLRIEVTESALTERGPAVRDAMLRFRAGGYQVWMDDFGSGVSSLNMLKDYPVDGLKIDLMFLRDFNENSRIIVESIVRMAKGLGIHTIAEGAETREQVDFLQSIGCEMIQGYYFGKPSLASALLARGRRLGTRIEPRFESQVYRKAGLVDLISESPQAVFSIKGDRLSLLCENPAYRTLLAGIGIDGIDAVNKIVASEDFLMRDKFLSYARKAIASGAEETATYVDAGRYLRMTLQDVGCVGDAHLLRVALADVTYDEEQGASRRYDEMVRSLALTYEGIAYLHVESDEIEIVETARSDERLKPGMLIPGIERTLADRARKLVHPDDRERFLSFVDLDNLHAAAERSQRSETCNLFRVKRDDGSWRWEIFDAIVLKRTKHKDVLLCSRADVMELQKDTRTLLPAFAASFGIALPSDGEEADLRVDLWRSYADFSRDPVFWKDRQGRYAGANRAFLEAFGLNSVDEISGKTDAELGWNADNAKEAALEGEVLEGGTPARDAVASCFVRGVPRTIVGSKFPVYRQGRIVGLEGSFRLIDEEDARADADRAALLANHESGLPGYRSMLMAGLRLADGYRIHGEDYLMVLMDVPEFDRVCSLYGTAFRRDLFACVHEALEGIGSLRGTLAHIGSCRFAYLETGADAAGLRSRLLAAASRVHAITEVDGCPCTLLLQYAMGSGSESRSFDGLMRLLTERLDEAEAESYGREALLGDRILLDREKFDHLEDPVGVWDLESCELLYLNEAYLRDLGLPSDFDYAGKTCHEVVEGFKEPCPFCKRGELSRERFATDIHHNHLTGVDYLCRDTLIPWRGKNRVLNICMNLESYRESDRERNEFIFREAAVNDALAAGMQASDPSEGIQRFIDRVGRTLGAERAYVFEDAGDGTVAATFEWRRDDDAPPLISELSHIPRSEVRALLDEFDRTPVTLIEDIDAFRRAHRGFIAHVDGVKSIVSGLLHLSNGRQGYTLVVNPSPSTFREASLLLTTLTRFLEVMLRNRDVVAHLKELSSTDQLTGVMNRRALAESLDRMPEGSEIALVFGDINGLKGINDREGHRKGDEVIRSVAGVMSSIVGRDRVFRMGGDEFLAIVEHADRRDLGKMAARMRREFARCGVSVALGWARYTMPLADVDAVISHVDWLMYADKEFHYFGRRIDDRRHPKPLALPSGEEGAGQGLS